MDLNDFLAMDFDTYHQIFGGDFLEYFTFMEEIKRPQLEDKMVVDALDEEILENIEEVLEEHESIDPKSTIILIILEMLASRYGDFKNFDNYLNMSDKDKILYLFSFLEKNGLSREQVIEKITNFYGRGRKNK
ncbi:MAG: hypothetical protein E7168_05360 [Firmicutes bacterium]|nr:hypothetical protein [Bacillota bacterium]